MKFDNFAKTESFGPVFLLNEDTYSSKFRYLSMWKPRNFYY